MKLLTITDEWDSGTVLLCEKHFRRLRKHIEAARSNGVTVITATVKQRGCHSCGSERIGYSPWCGAMFKIWKGFGQNKSEFDSN